MLRRLGASDVRPSNSTLSRDLNSNTPAAAARRRKWAAGLPGCPECGGEGRVRRQPLKKDGTPRKLLRWERCACVAATGLPQGRSATSRPVVLHGVPLEAPPAYPLGFVRPRYYHQCVGGPRPCPLVGCRANTYLEPVNGGRSLRVQWGDRQPEDVPPGESCIEDLVEAHPDGMTLDEIARVLGCTRERVRQVETVALAKIFRRLSTVDPATNERVLTPAGEELRDALYARAAARDQRHPLAALAEEGDHGG